VETKNCFLSWRTNRLSRSSTTWSQTTLHWHWPSFCCVPYIWSVYFVCFNYFFYNFFADQQKKLTSKIYYCHLLPNIDNDS
jgi:hypothetical protein